MSNIINGYWKIRHDDVRQLWNVAFIVKSENPNPCVVGGGFAYESVVFDDKRRAMNHIKNGGLSGKLRGNLIDEKGDIVAGWIEEQNNTTRRV